MHIKIFNKILDKPFLWNNQEFGCSSRFQLWETVTQKEAKHAI